MILRSSHAPAITRMRNLLNAAWRALASVTSAAFSAALVTGRDALLVITLLSVVATLVSTLVRALRLMENAAEEVGAPWPRGR